MTAQHNICDGELAGSSLHCPDRPATGSCEDEAPSCHGLAASMLPDLRSLTGNRISAPTLLGHNIL